MYSSRLKVFAEDLLRGPQLVSYPATAYAHRAISSGYAIGSHATAGRKRTDTVLERVTRCDTTKKKKATVIAISYLSACEGYLE